MAKCLAGIVATALIPLAGCATIQPSPFPVTARTSEDVVVESPYVRGEKRGISVSGFARRLSFNTLPWGSHIHVTASLKDGSVVVADAAWRPMTRRQGRTAFRRTSRTALYRTVLRNVAMTDVLRIDVEFRRTKD